METIPNTSFIGLQQQFVLGKKKKKMLRRLTRYTLSLEGPTRLRTLVLAVFCSPLKIRVLFWNLKGGKWSASVSVAPNIKCGLQLAAHPSIPGGLHHSSQEHIYLILFFLLTHKVEERWCFINALEITFFFLPLLAAPPIFSPKKHRL